MTDTPKPQLPGSDQSNVGSWSRALDAAVAVTIATAVLYALGGIFWRQYLRQFNLTLEVVGLSFEQVLSTTWIAALLIAFGGAIVFAEVQRSPFTGTRLRASAIIPAIGLIIGIPLALAVHLVTRNAWVAVVACLTVLGLALIVSLRFVEKSIHLDKLVGDPYNRLSVGMAVCSVLFLLYGAGGALVGKIDRAGVSPRAITCLVFVKGSSGIPPQFQFIARTDGFVFLLARDSTGAALSTVMLPVSAIAEAVVQRCKPPS